MRSPGLVAAWTIALALGLAALGTVRLAWLDPPTPACVAGIEHLELRSLAGAEALRYRDRGEQTETLAWLEARFASPDPEGPGSIAHVYVASGLSGFIGHPSWLLPSLGLPSDPVVRGTLDGPEGPVPAYFRTSDESATVAGWAYAIGDDPVDHPVAHALARAFAQPLSPTPPVTMISFDVRGGPYDTRERTELVERRLSMLWREWEARCRE